MFGAGKSHIHQPTEVFRQFDPLFRRVCRCLRLSQRIETGTHLAGLPSSIDVNLRLEYLCRGS